MAKAKEKRRRGWRKAVEVHIYWGFGLLRALLLIAEGTLEKRALKLVYGKCCFYPQGFPTAIGFE